MTSCIGQTKTSPANLPGVPESTPAERKARLIKTQGSNAHQNIHCSLQDKDGNLWFGTTGEGVYRMTEKNFPNSRRKKSLTQWNVKESRFTIFNQSL